MAVYLSGSLYAFYMHQGAMIIGRAERLTGIDGTMSEPTAYEMTRRAVHLENTTSHVRG